MALDRDTEKLNAVKKMMDACDKDPSLQAQLFRDSEAVAKKFGVQLAPEEKAQLGKVAELYRVVDEFTAGRTVGPGPIFYPIDVWWKRKIFDHVLRYRPIYYPIYYPIFYPIDLGNIELAQRFNALRFRR